MLAGGFELIQASTGERSGGRAIFGFVEGVDGEKHTAEEGGQNSRQNENCQEHFDESEAVLVGEKAFFCHVNHSIHYSDRWVNQYNNHHY